jgi:phage gpG-like protein
MSPEQFEKYLASMQIKLEKSIPKIAKKAAEDVVLLFKENFLEEGFFGDRWAEVERRKNEKNYRIISRGKRKGEKKYKNNRLGAKILTQSGNLRSSIKVDDNIVDNTATIYSDAEYSKAHNEGTTTAGRNRNVTIPKRQFIGNSKEVEEAIEKRINEELEKIFNK